MIRESEDLPEGSYPPKVRGTTLVFRLPDKKGKSGLLFDYKQAQAFRAVKKGGILCFIHGCFLVR